MKKIIWSVALFLQLLLSKAWAQFKSGPARWEAEVAAFEKADRLHPPSKNGILFTGSSSIRLWKNLPEQFEQEKLLNRGIGGAQLSDLIYFADRLIYSYHPKKIFVYCGGNDISAGQSPEQVADDFRKLAQDIRQHLPKAQLYFISIQTAPVRADKSKAIQQANSLIQEYLEREKAGIFINVYPLLLDDQGRPKAEYFLTDSLHMNAKGYEKWIPVLKPYVEK